MNIWIIGAGGMLGTELGLLCTAQGLPWVGTDKEVDIRNPDALRAFASLQASQGKPVAWIFNCAAYTAVDQAEEQYDLAWSLNALGPAHIATMASQIGARLVHVSTDYVFDGSVPLDAAGQPRALTEDDPRGPQGAYGKTKAEGEDLVLQNHHASFVLRTAWLYGAHGPNFVATMLRLMAAKSELGIVADQFGSPTWARDLARLMVHLVRSDATAYGVYHASGEGRCSWFDFAGEIQRLGVSRGILAAAIPLCPLTTAQYPTKAPRPAWSVLAKEKLYHTFGFEMPTWERSLEEFMDQCSAQYMNAQG